MYEIASQNSTRKDSKSGMATTIKDTEQTGKAPSAPVKHKRLASGKGSGRRQSRFVQRLRYVVNHPINGIWGWLSSVRNAIYLIVAIVIVCFIGIYFPQAPREVLGDSTAYAAWVQQNALASYGSLTPIFDWLQFFTVFSSWYFKLLLTLLSLSIVVCTLNRAPAIWHNFAHPLIRRSDKFYKNSLERAEFTAPDAVKWTTAALRRRHYRVRSTIVEQETSAVTYLYANKNSWATLSTFVFHAALVSLLMAGVISQWRGFDPNSPARRLLPAPIVSLSDALAGFSFDQALPNGQSAVVYPRGTAHNVSFRVNSFKATFDPKTGMATDYVTDLSVYRDGELVAHSNSLRVNSPLSYDGIVFHQSSLIASASVTITDQHGYVLFNQPVVLDESETLPNGQQVDLATNIQVGDTNMVMSILFPHDPSLQLAQVHNPLMLVTIGSPGVSASQDKAVLPLRPGQSGQSKDKQWTITLNSAGEATVLLVTKDAGAMFIWPIAVILILSLCITFYFPQRRIWIRIEDDSVQIAALREHFTNIRTDLLGISREANTKPL
jgi:cytochrome c biogenesis protein